jgi:hypothetical protein
MLGAQLGVNLNFLSHLVAITAGMIIDAIIHPPVTAREAEGGFGT